MKKYLIPIFVALASYILINYLTLPRTTGYIMQINEDGILVVEDQVSQKSGIYRSIWLTLPFYLRFNEKLDVGNKVSVSYSRNVNESLPAQASARSISLITSKDIKANLSQEKVIQIALSSLEDDTTFIQAVKDISFDGNKGEWSVHLLDSLYPSDHPQFIIFIDDLEATVINVEKLP